jgi:SAM domain (Sterile alpha motif)
MDIVVWLRSLGLGKYEAAFRENDIDETVLPSLTHENLKELGVTSLGHRVKLLDAIAALRNDAGGKAPRFKVVRCCPLSKQKPRDRLRGFDGGPLGGWGASGLRPAVTHTSFHASISFPEISGVRSIPAIPRRSAGALCASLTASQKQGRWTPTSLSPVGYSYIPQHWD